MSGAINKKEFLDAFSGEKELNTSQRAQILYQAYSALLIADQEGVFDECKV